MTSLRLNELGRTGVTTTVAGVILISSILFTVGMGLGAQHQAPAGSPAQSGTLDSSRGASSNYWTYFSEPAPMGIADYGKGPGGNYSYSTSSFLGVADIGSLSTRNATGNSAMTFQLNVNLQIRVSAIRVVHIWIQNTADLDTAAKTILISSDVWNESSTNSSMLATAVSGSGSVYPCGCVGGGPADYAAYASTTQPGGDTSYSLPLPLMLQVNASSTSAGTPYVNFSYQDGYGWQTYDTLSFNAFSGVPPSDVRFIVNGALFNPDGSFENSEFILGGEGNGLNTTAVASNVMLRLDFWNGHNYQEVYNAYNFGGNTAEGIDNVKTSLSVSPNGSLAVELVPGTGGLGPVYNQSEVGILSVAVPFSSGVLSVQNASTQSGQIMGTVPFVGSLVNVTLAPGSYILKLYPLDGSPARAATAALSGGQVLKIDAASFTTSSSTDTQTSSSASVGVTSSSLPGTGPTAKSTIAAAGSGLTLQNAVAILALVLATLVFSAIFLTRRRNKQPALYPVSGQQGMNHRAY